jgi:hypothetical protein
MFYKCYAPASSTIPENVTSIGDGTFVGCHSLTSATIVSFSGNTVSGGVIDKYFDKTSEHWKLPGQASESITDLTIGGISDSVLDPNNADAGIYGTDGLALTYEYGSITNVYNYDSVSERWVLTSHTDTSPVTEYDITFRQGLGYTVYPSYATVSPSGTVMFTVSVLSGYDLRGVFSDGGIVRSLGGERYMLSDVTEDTVVWASATEYAPDVSDTDDGNGPTEWIPVIAAAAAALAMIAVSVVYLKRK